MSTHSPSAHELYQGYYLEEALKQLIHHPNNQSNSSPEERQLIEHLFAQSRRLHTKLQEAARRLEEPDPLLAELEQKRSVLRRSSAIVVDAEPFQPSGANPPVPTEKPAHTTQPVLGPPHMAGVVSSGPEIEWLQRCLQELGFSVPLSGQFDNFTLKAVRNFQLKAKLKITGQVDEATRNMLQRYQKRRVDKADKERLSPAAHPVAPENSGSVSSTQLEVDLGQEGTGGTSQGPQVLLLQRALGRAGFLLECTGVFDQRTFAAVRSFQARHKLPVNGRVGARERVLLNSLVREALAEDRLLQGLQQVLEGLAQACALEFTPVFQQLMLRRARQALHSILAQPACENPPPLSPLPPLPSYILTQNLGTPGEQRVVSQGEEVIWLQEMLQAAGFTLKINGMFDLQTYTALRQWQACEGLPAHGRVDEATRQHLNSLLKQRRVRETAIRHCLEHLRALPVAVGREPPPDWDTTMEALARELVDILHQGLEAHKQAFRATLPAALCSDLGPLGRPQRVSQGDEVILLQWLLREQGYEVPESGIYDAATALAVRNFQRQHKLPLTGEVDARTREKLNA